MSTSIDYHLSIRTETPKTVIEGEPFKVTYHIKNLGENVFPGGDIEIRLSWTQLGGRSGPYVTYPIHITRAIQPNGEFTYPTEALPIASGYTMFYPVFTERTGPNNYIQIPNGRIFLHHEDGRLIREGGVFGGVRARSHEEIEQAREVRIALLALFLIVIFQAIDWILRYLIFLEF